MRHFNANFDQVDSEQVDKALSLLLLDNKKKSLIDVGLGHLHTPIIPIIQNRWMIDHAWIGEFLYSLFFQVKLSNENFKGAYLEKFISRSKPPLTSSRLNGLDETSRQIDASFRIGSVLIIVECKAFARSVGIQRGQRQALRYRSDRISKALDEADDKAQWLSERPTGRNYDISGFTAIFPIAITPFIEFIPSESSRYWITATIPRVLSPDEFQSTLSSVREGELLSSPNIVQITGNRGRVTLL
jgi:hypothetical protein